MPDPLEPTVPNYSASDTAKQSIAHIQSDLHNLTNIISQHGEFMKEIKRSLEDHRLVSAERAAKVDLMMYEIDAQRKRIDIHDDKLVSLDEKILNTNLILKELEEQKKKVDTHEKQIDQLNTKITKIIIYAALAAGGVTFGIDKIPAILP